MAEKRGDGDSKATKAEEEETSAVFVSIGEQSAYYSPCSEMNKKSATDCEEYLEEDEEDECDEEKEEMARILKDQLEQLRRENEWSKAGAEALRAEMGGDGDDSNAETATQSMSEYQWSAFLYDWRRKFGEWGKRVLDVSQCENNDRLKAGHLLIEIYRRRRALASCKAHILNLLRAAGQEKPIETATTSKED